MFVRKIGNNWYICSKINKSTKGGLHNKRKWKFKDWFLIKYREDCGVLDTRHTIFPKEFIGKRIRLKVEVIK